MKYRIFFFSFLISGLCYSQNNPLEYWPTESWKRSSPEMQGMDSKAISETVELALQKKLKIHSLLIIRNGYMVADINFYPYSGKTIHDMASATKSITSMLTGIAIGQGFIKDENVPVSEIFPEYKDDFKDGNLTIGNLLSMRSGLGSDDNALKPDWFKEPLLLRMIQSEHWLDYLAALPVTVTPGKEYQYNSCNYHLLSEILHRTSGLPTRQFAQQNLFKPLGISNFIWDEDTRGNSHGWGDLKLHPYDMAKLGYLMMKKGKWEGRQVIPEEWVKKSTSLQVDLPDKNGPFNIDYGYGWYVMSGIMSGVYQATGRGGQYITVWPEKNLVIVYTGGGFDAAVLAQALLGSIISDKPVPENEVADSALQRMILKAGQNPVTDPVETAQLNLSGFSGRSWLLEDNPFRFKTLHIGKFNPNTFELTIESDFFEFDALPVSFDNSLEITPNGRYHLPMCATAIWKNQNEIELTVNEISNINFYTINLLFDKENLVFRFMERSMMNSELVVKGFPEEKP